MKQETKNTIVAVALTAFIMTTGVGGYFTYKYFDLKNSLNDSGSQVMTIKKAGEIVNEACEELGLIPSSSGVSTQSVTYQDYDGELVTGDESGENFFKSNLAISNYILYIILEYCSFLYVQLNQIIY